MSQFISFVLLSLLIASNAASGNVCSEADNTVAIIECHNNRYATADKELNAVYQEAMSSLPDDGARKQLKEAQRAWLKYRDTSIAFIKEINKDYRSYGRIVVSDYAAKLVEKRVLELKYLMSGPESPPVEW